MAFLLTSPAFNAEQPIPKRFSCDGVNISPPLHWKGAPAEAKSFALIADDPDAPKATWIHWVIYNLPATCNNLSEDIPGNLHLPEGGVHGNNSWSKLGYGGPCPPSGTHRYYFKLYALDRVLQIAPGATKAALLAAMEGHILDQAELMGTYNRNM
ncbi:YbhB/YbcL family Raf kinase inhibitor-like protein [Sulfurirhabdus autotrophica]|uniref:PBP family phospholipid-binding protein n=1 Tax=Sulfurirhabdus autotrophica TaxID=1706046 RepID=A0A4R3Y727_9PROT|nr:YbhB/YbcL family Raf kinase inhibitor-like protein [Sulfurirhabdus autotrophica]TCV86698.1 PBP family phospholipid-binding protein [Sulfurirhabdus autotrophica]